MLFVVGVLREVENGGPKIVKNGPRVWAFCKIEFPGIQKPVHIFGQKSAFFEKCGNRGVGVIWPVRGWFLLMLLVWAWFGCGLFRLGLLFLLSFLCGVLWDYLAVKSSQVLNNRGLHIIVFKLIINTNSENICIIK